MLHSRRRVGASPAYWLIMPLVAACGTGMVKVIGLWNLRRRGSTVTIGLTATRWPKSLVTSSAGIGWAWKIKHTQETLSSTQTNNGATTCKKKLFCLKHRCHQKVKEIKPLSFKNKWASHTFPVQHRNISLMIIRASKLYLGWQIQQQSMNN